RPVLPPEGARLEGLLRALSRRPAPKGRIDETVDGPHVVGISPRDVDLSQKTQRFQVEPRRQRSGVDRYLGAVGRAEVKGRDHKGPPHLSLTPSWVCNPLPIC